MSQVNKERLEQKHKITQADFNDSEIGTYLDLDPTRSMLDGLFTSKELRRIADAMDEWSKENEASFCRLLGEKT